MINIMRNLRPSCFRIDKNVVSGTEKRPTNIFRKEVSPEVSPKTQVPLELDRTDKNNIAQPKMNLLNFKGTPDSLKERFKGSMRKSSLGASVLLWYPCS